MNGKAAVDRFILLVREYCCWAEGQALPSEEEAKRATGLLARLYAAALELPSIEPQSDELGEGVSDDELQRVCKRFASLPFQYYFEIFNPVAAPPEEAVLGDLCDDLADIYRDLKDGLAMLEGGSERDAIFHWKTHFEFHWGRHTTSALHALHCYRTMV